MGGKRGPGSQVSWAGWWRQQISGGGRRSGGNGSLLSGILTAPSSVHRVYLTLADLPSQPYRQGWGTTGAKGRRGAANPEQLREVPVSETIIPIIQSQGSTTPAFCLVGECSANWMEMDGGAPSPPAPCQTRGNYCPARIDTLPATLTPARGPTGCPRRLGYSLSRLHNNQT